METLVRDLVSVGENNTINGIDGHNKIGRMTSRQNSWIKLAKSKNTVQPNFLAKSKLLVGLSFKARFLI